MTDLRGLQSLGNDDRSPFAAPGMADQLRAHNPLHIALVPDDLAWAYVFLASRNSGPRHHRQHRHGRCRGDAARAAPALPRIGGR